MLSNPLIATKFQTPLPRANRVTRSRLLEKLEEGRRGGSRLTLISAPAGYGKTTLAAEWLSQETALAWFTLDTSDSDPARFFTGLVTALSRIDPALGMRTRSLLSIPQMPGIEVIMGELINEIHEIAQPFILALDDYHNVQTPAVHEAIETLLDHQPDNLHLLITTREDPPFPLGRLRVRGQLTEVRVRDLRFTPEESKEFLAQVYRLDLPDTLLDQLEKLTEGWAAGLQLTGLALEGETDLPGFFATFGGSHQFVIDYLLEEVLRRQSDEITRFLQRTALLERFNADLGTAILGPEVHIRGILAYLERTNLFLMPLDSSRTWFRYHNLFRDVLRAGLDPSQEAEIHRRAADWFERQGLNAEAIQHFLAAGEIHPAARLIGLSAYELMKNGQLHTLLAWAKALPTEEILADGSLAAFYVLALVLTGDVPRASGLLRQMEEQKPAGIQTRPAPLMAVKAWLSMTTGNGAQNLPLAQQALNLLGPEEGIFQVLALLALGTAHMWKHDLSASTRFFEQAYHLGQELDHTFATLGALANLAYNLIDLGQLQKAYALCNSAYLRYTDPRGHPLPVVGLIDLPLSTICLERNEIDQAKAYAQQGQERCQKLFSSLMMGGDAEASLAVIALLEGSLEDALQILHQARQFGIQHRVPFLEYKMNGVEVDLRIRAGDLRGARDALDRIKLSAEKSTPGVPSMINLLQARLSLAEGNPHACLEGLVDVETAYRSEGMPGRLIALLALKALALHHLSREEAACCTMEEAVRLAAPDGYLRSLVRAGPGIAPLLLKVRSAAPEHVDRLLAILPETTADRSRPDSQARAPEPAVRKDQPGLEEPLSEQEQNVLRLVAAGLSNQEIAERLVISPGTAKWHVHNILSKLGASSRAQAAALARELGLLA